MAEIVESNIQSVEPLTCRLKQEKEESPELRFLDSEDLSCLEESSALLQSVFNVAYDNVAPFLDDYTISEQDFLLIGVLDVLTFIQDYRNMHSIGVEVTDEVTEELLNELLEFNFVNDRFESFRSSASIELNDFDIVLREKFYSLFKMSLVGPVERNLGYKLGMPANLDRTVCPLGIDNKKYLMENGLTPAEAFSAPPLLISLFRYGREIGISNDSLLLGYIFDSMRSLVVGENSVEILEDMRKGLGIGEQSISSEIIDIELEAEDIEYLLEEITSWEIFRDLVNSVDVVSDLDLEASYSEQLEFLDGIDIYNIRLEREKYVVKCYREVLRTLEEL